MSERPILRLLNSRPAARKTGSPLNIPRPRGPGRQRQGVRFQATFDRLSEALGSHNPSIELRNDPAGIAPERALVFVTACGIQDFARVARNVGMEVISELDLDNTDDFPDGFEPAGEGASLTPALYTTMPTIQSFDSLLAFWRAYNRNENAPHGAAPWWKLFDLLLELRPWGPEDRFPQSARTAVAERLPFDDGDEVSIEFEIWPTISAEKRTNWRIETEAKIQEHGGRIIDRSSIAGDGFIYEAILAGLSAGSIRELIENPNALDGLASIEGVQFILPQTIVQTLPTDGDGGDEEATSLDRFDPDAPIRAVLLDGTPVAAHPVLDGGVVIEDVHDLVRLSQVDQRYHATSMASLILRGDLDSDGAPLMDARIVSVPLLIDADGTALSPPDKLFVDLLHTALVRLFLGDEPFAPQAFVVNFSIGVSDVRFAGRISSLARLIDWWAYREGLLFVISAGNIPEDLLIPGVTALDFENADAAEKRNIVRAALRANTHNRCLLSPAEALNGITVGAISEDLSNGNPPPDIASVFRLETDEESLPPISSALGLGPFRAIKPDLLTTGGIHEMRLFPNLGDARLGLLAAARTGLIVASPRRGVDSPTHRARGTSCAAALTTRALLQSAEGLITDGGPYQGQELPREDLALLTRALAVNTARWPEVAHDLYQEELRRLGSSRHARAKQEVARHFGHGVLTPMLMQESPGTGVTLVGLGDVRKDQAKIFDLPLPESLSGGRVERSMCVTLAWFSPVDPSRVRYRLASLEAIAFDIGDEEDDDKDNGWGLNLKGEGPDSNMVKRGTVWSRRLVNDRLTAPAYESGASVPIRVQCRDAGGGLDPNLDIRFAIAVTLEVETTVEYDVHQEVRAEIALRLRRGS